MTFLLEYSATRLRKSLKYVKMVAEKRNGCGKDVSNSFSISYSDMQMKHQNVWNDLVPSRLQRVQRQYVTRAKQTW